MILLSLIFSLNSASADSQPQYNRVFRHSVGLSEKLGVFGLYNASSAIKDESNEYFFVAGTTVLIFGGAGIGWKHNFNDKVISPYSCITGFGVYYLPAMCPNCTGVRTEAFLSASVGVDLRLFRTKRYASHIQAGIYSAFNLSRMEVFESPSDIPGIWPILNLSLTRQKTTP